MKESKREAAGKSIILRPMKQEDCLAISRLAQTSFTMPWSEDAFREAIVRKDSLYVIAIANNEPIGCCGVTNACGDGDIYNVAVDPKWRSLGIGKWMLGTLMDWGLKLGIVNYTLEVRVTNTAAIGLYESLGFKSEGIRPGFYEQPREDAMIMWKRQEENEKFTMPE